MNFCNPSEGADVRLNECLQKLGQLQKIGLQYLKNGTTKNKITDPKELANWQPFLDATDATKIVMSPFIAAPANEPGAPVVFGGGNDTVDRIEVVIGREASGFNGQIHSVKQNTIEDLKKWMHYLNIGAWWFDGEGNIGCLTDNINTPTEYYPIPMKAFFVGDLQPGHSDSVDMNAISWKLKPNWSDKFVVIKATDFSPVDDLIKTPVVIP